MSAAYAQIRVLTCAACPHSTREHDDIYGCLQCSCPFVEEQWRVVMADKYAPR
jgi:hypothetical protein